MPRVDFKLWDRVYMLKLICSAQMTYSSFVALVYFYLIILQDWTCRETERKVIMKIKWGVIGISALEFGLGTLLAFAANMTGIRRRRGIIAWIILETFLVPISIALLMQLYYRIVASAVQYTTDPHYARVNIAQVCFLLCQFIFITYALDFLVYTEKKPKLYDPSIRPESVYAPTDPQITTTESRHIRMSQSFLFQPSSSKKVTSSQFSHEEKGKSSSSSSDTDIRKKEVDYEDSGKDEHSRHQKGVKESEDWMKDDMGWSVKEHNKTIPSSNTLKPYEMEWKEEDEEEWTGNVERNERDDKKE